MGVIQGLWTNIQLETSKKYQRNICTNMETNSLNLLWRHLVKRGQFLHPISHDLLVVTLLLLPQACQFLPDAPQSCDLLSLRSEELYATLVARTRQEAEGHDTVKRVR